MQVEEVLEHVNVPSYHIDTSGVIRWLNRAAKNIVGDVRGRQFTSVVAPEETLRAKELFARKIVGGTEVTDAPVVVLGQDGVFGQVSSLVEEPHEHPDLQLTPRQAEVLGLLERGRTTKEIADELHVSPETVRNHVKRLLRAVGAHSRLEAVAIAHSTA
jgi:DNA-binding CsgD family transcriptional regulator